MSSRARWVYPGCQLRQQVTTAFLVGVFVGMAAATRRNDHFYLTEITSGITGAPPALEIANRLVVLIVSLLLVVG